MDNKETIRKLIRLNPKLQSKYGYLADAWWRVPQEDYLIAEFKMRTNTGVAIVSWIVTSFSLIFDTLSLVSKNQTSTIMWTVCAMFFGIMGFLYLNKSNKFKLQLQNEKEKYHKALQTKNSTDRKIRLTLQSAELELRDTLHQGLEKAQTFKQIVLLLENLAFLGRESLESLRDAYGRNKVYEYNLNEPNEIESFKEVDSYKAYDDAYQEMISILELIFKCKDFAEKENEGAFQHQMEKLIAILPELQYEERKSMEDEDMFQY